MKIKLKFLMGLIILMVVLGCQLNVFAADIPIKKIVSLNDDLIIILAENGDLYWTNSLYSSTKELVTKNVIDLCLEKDSVFDEYIAYTSDNRIIVFDSKYVSSTDSHVLFINEEMQGNVKIPIDLPSKYIDTANNLIAHDEVFAENVIAADDNLYLTSDGNLYFYGSFDEEETKFLMSDIKEFNDKFFLKNNGDLYYYGDNEVINKALSNVDDCSHIVEYNGHYYLIDANNNLYFSNYAPEENITFTKIADNMKDLYYFPGGSYTVYSVDIYGNLYDVNEQNILKKDTKGQKITNIMSPFRELFFTENGILLKGFSPVYETGSIKGVFYVRGDYDEGDYYAYINTSGDVWTSLTDMTNFEKTQLSEKSTVLKIDGKECKLENKIQVIDGRTMYPFRECLNLIGASVYWDGDNQIAIGEVPGVKIEFPIGRSEYYVNGIRYEMDTKAYVDTSIGRTYIPLRYAAESLGYKVEWIPGDTENTISIHK